jgi:hypothetical protein
LRGKKAVILVLIFCISFSVVGIGVKNLFAVWVPCTETIQPQCEWPDIGCWAWAEYTILQCVIFDCFASPGYFDCHIDP